MVSLDSCALEGSASSVALVSATRWRQKVVLQMWELNRMRGLQRGRALMNERGLDRRAGWRSFSFCRGRPGIGQWELKTDRTLGTTRGHVDRDGRPMTCEPVTDGASRKNAPVRACTASLSCRRRHRGSHGLAFLRNTSGRCLHGGVDTRTPHGMLANDQAARDNAARCDTALCQGWTSMFPPCLGRKPGSCIELARILT